MQNPTLRILPKNERGILYFRAEVNNFVGEERRNNISNFPFLLFHLRRISFTIRTRENRNRNENRTYTIVLLSRFVEKSSRVSFTVEARITDVVDFLSKSDHGLLQLEFALGQRNRLTLQNLIFTSCNETLLENNTIPDSSSIPPFFRLSNFVGKSPWRGANERSVSPSSFSLFVSLGAHFLSRFFFLSFLSLFFFYIYLPSIDICLRISPRVSFNVSFCRFNTSFPRLSSSSSFRAVKINASIKRNALLVLTSYYCYFNYKRLCKCRTFDETRFNARVMKFVRSLKFFAISFDLKVHRKRDRREFEIKIRTSLRGDEQRAFISDTKEV